MDGKIENEEVKEYLVNMSINRLQNCEAFTRTFGKKFAANRLKNNLCKVYTNEINNKYNGYAILNGKGASTITICCEKETNEPLSVEQIEKNPEIKATVLHEAIHIILEKTKQECKNASIDSGTGVMEKLTFAEIGRGLNEGLTNWIVRKTGIHINSYKTHTNFMEELELAIGEDKVMALGKGNLSKRIPKLLKMDFDECLRVFAIGDEIFELEEQISNEENILDIVEKYLKRDEVNPEDREKVEEQYKQLLQEGTKEEYRQEKLKYRIFSAKENKTDTPENRKDFFKNQLIENTLRHLKLKSEFESIIYEKYFENEFEQVVKSGKEPNLQQLRKWEHLWNLITEDGVQKDTPIATFKENYEGMREQYLEDIVLKAKGEFQNGNLSGKKLVELLGKSSEFGSDFSNKRLLSTVAQLIAPNFSDALYVQKLLESLDFEQLENINKYEMSITTYCAGDINIPVYIKNGKIVGNFSPYSRPAFPQMKIASEKELKDENAIVFDYTADLEEGGYTTAKEEALQIYQQALSLDSATKMKILDRMIILESGAGTQTPYIISSGHVLSMFPQKGSTININLAPNPIEIPTVQNESVFSKFIIGIKRKFSKKPEEDIYYKNATSDKSKIFRESMRFEDGKEESEANTFETNQNEIKISKGNQTRDNGLSR